MALEAVVEYRDRVQGAAPHRDLALALVWVQVVFLGTVREWDLEMAHATVVARLVQPVVMVQKERVEQVEWVEWVVRVLAVADRMVQ